LFCTAEMTRGLLLVAWLVVLVVWCGTAQAATVSATSPGFVLYAAADGETNDVDMSLGSAPDHIVVRDAGAPLEALSDCISIDQHTADCTIRPGRTYADADLKMGDGDDRAVVDAPIIGRISGGAGDDSLTGCVTHGGDGNDTLTGCDGVGPQFLHELHGDAGDDMLTGGDGNDTMDGGAGRDTLRGGAGDDLLLSGVNYYETVGEYYDGGPGRDELSYGTGRTSTVDLTARTARRDNGEVSSVIGIEDVRTGPGDNLLIGDDADNRLDGGPGADMIDARGGADTIVDTEGADAIRAGPGDDRVMAADLYRDSIDCGEGADRVATDRADGRLSGCEGRELVSYDVIPPRLHVSGGAVLVAPRCFRETQAIGIVTEGLGTCALRMALDIRFRGRDLVAGRTQCTNPFECTYDVQLSKRARKLLRGRSLNGIVVYERALGPGGIRVRERVTVVRGR
jgi:Ca2+-binding RTX toxin-like protein